MSRATKKGLNEALKPLFAEADRYALGLTTGGTRAPRHTPISWRGFTIDIAIIRRARVVTGVPFPFACFEFWYEASLDGKVVVQVGGRPSFIDALFHYCARNNVDLRA